MDQTDINSIDTWYAKNACNILVKLYMKLGARRKIFRTAQMIGAIMDLLKIPNTHRVNKRDPLNVNPDRDEAVYIFNLLKAKGDIRPATKKYEGSGSNKRTIQYYRLDKYKLANCKRKSPYYKKIQYKRTQQEKTGKLDYRKCDLLVTLYAYFKDQPFTYTMVKNVFDVINNMESDKYREKELLSNIRKRYGNKDLLDIWNALVQNGMIKKYKPKSTLREKSLENEYKIIKSYVEYCAKKI